MTGGGGNQKMFRTEQIDSTKCTKLIMCMFFFAKFLSIRGVIAIVEPHLIS